MDGKKVASDILQRLKYYKQLGDKTFTQLEDDDFFWQPDAESNSIAIIIQHLYGNMMSRFTHFLTEDGEKPWRKRDAEFEAMEVSRKDLLDFWETGWSTVFNAIATLESADMDKQITIRTEPLKAYDALLRQLAHYPYHVGQIVYIGRMRRGAAWQSLSIPKGNSKAYNEAMANGGHSEGKEATA